MAVNLVKPNPSDDDPSEAVELVAVDDLMDEDGGVTAQPSRLRAWWDQLLEDAERSANAPRTRFVTRPELGSYNVFTAASLATVKTGTVVIFRGTWTLIRRARLIVLGYVRKAKGAKPPPTPAAPEETGDDAKAKGAAKGRGGKSAAAKKKGRKKKPPTKNSGTGDVIVGGLLIAGMGVLFLTRTVVPALAALATDTATWVADHPLDVARGTGAVVIVFVVIAWIVGGVVGVREDHDRGADEEAAEAESPEDHEGDQGSGEVETGPEDGAMVEPSPADEADEARIRVYEWVRQSIDSIGNGRAVHLRELLLSIQKEEGGEKTTMAELRAGLEGHDITIRDGVKAPASDHAGATRNRPGVHRDDLPQGFTPLPAQGTNLIRLLPTYQASDQQ
ncbi:hypothetical protein [Streptomyces antimycoticus]|uniref:hypothetical protein n=1 Tax=Streptomyces antimycoticus TaxID=68175 RepID=UPI0036EC59D6